MEARGDDTYRYEKRMTLLLLLLLFETLKHDFSFLSNFERTLLKYTWCILRAKHMFSRFYVAFAVVYCCCAAV